MEILRVLNLVIGAIALYPVIRVFLYLLNQYKFNLLTHQPQRTVNYHMILLFALLFFYLAYSTIYYFIQIFMPDSFNNISFSTISSIRTLVGSCAILYLGINFQRLII